MPLGSGYLSSYVNNFCSAFLHNYQASMFTGSTGLLSLCGWWVRVPAPELLQLLHGWWRLLEQGVCQRAGKRLRQKCANLFILSVQWSSEDRFCYSGPPSSAQRDKWLSKAQCRSGSGSTSWNTLAYIICRPSPLSLFSVIFLSFSFFFCIKNSQQFISFPCFFLSNFSLRTSTGILTVLSAGLSHSSFV